MATEHDAISPKQNEEEIKAQLQRVLASNLFIGNENSSNFLELIVNKVLKGEPIKQSIIALELFPAAYSSGKFDRVRLTAMQLRRILAEYYEQEGRDDRIVITLPPPPGPNRRLPAGKSYTPIFLYNSRSPAVMAHEQGLNQHQPNVRGLEQYVRAIRLFDEAICADPKYAPAYAARAEADIWGAMYRQYIPPYKPIEHAEQFAKEALRLQPGFWQAHLVLGAVNSCRYQWTQAQMCFDAAIETARDKVLDHPWYPAFLLATGRQQEALRIANARVAEKPGSMPALLALAFFLYVSGRSTHMEPIIDDLRRHFPENWLTEVVYVLKSLSQFKSVSVKHAFRRLREDLLPPYDDPYPFPALEFLGVMQKKFLGFQARERDVDISDEPVDLRCADYWHTYEEYKQRAKLDDNSSGPYYLYLEQYRFWPPLQRAIAYMAKNDLQNAVHSLHRAMDEGDPLTVFLDMLPLFDLLREGPGFQELIKRMQLPKK